MKDTYRLWHRFDTNNVKYIKRFPLLDNPNTSTTVGFTEWRLGTGPHTELALQNLRTAQAKYCRGVPKSPQTKEKMRQAKLGKPKSEQHKLNMKLSHQRRRELIKEDNGTTKEKSKRESYTN